MAMSKFNMTTLPKSAAVVKTAMAPKPRSYSTSTSKSPSMVVKDLPAVRRRCREERGDWETRSFYTIIGYHCLPFLRDLHSSLVAIAFIFGQNDSVAHG